MRFAIRATLYLVLMMPLHSWTHDPQLRVEDHITEAMRQKAEVESQNNQPQKPAKTETAQDQSANRETSSVNAADIKKLQELTNQMGAMAPNSEKLKQTLKQLQESNTQIEKRNQMIENLGNE